MEPLALERGLELSREHGALEIERGGGVRSGELKAQLGAGDGGAGRLHDQREIGGLDGALQPIPLRTGNAPEIGGGRASEIENDEPEVGVAGEQVGGLQRGRRAGAAHPDEMGEQVGGKRSRVERIRAVDQREPRAGGTGGGEQLPEQQVAAATRRCTDDLGDGAERESAGRLVDGRDAGGQRAARRTGCGRKTLGEQMPERRELGVRGGHGTEEILTADSADNADGDETAAFLTRGEDRDHGRLREWFIRAIRVIRGGSAWVRPRSRVQAAWGHAAPPLAGFDAAPGFTERFPEAEQRVPAKNVQMPEGVQVEQDGALVGAGTGEEEFHGGRGRWS